MLAYIQTHGAEIWAILASLLFGLSELLGWSEKFKSSSVFEFFFRIVKKGAGKDVPETKAEAKVEEQK